MFKLCVFLGNPGQQYRANRHNVAWQFLASMDCLPSARFSQKFKGQYARQDFVIEGETQNISLLLPTTYMNLSGESVRECAQFLHIALEEILIVHDELELGLGFFGFKWGGGLGGHNGLRSMEANFNSRDFARLRIGIGRPNHADIAGYVLSDFARDEEDCLNNSVFPRAQAKFIEALGAKNFPQFAERFKKVNTLSL